MTTTEQIRQQKVRRMKELFDISRQRYLDAGGNPHLSVGTLHGNENFTEEEKQEFLELANQVFDDEYIANYLKTHSTWRERMAAMKEKMRTAE